MVRNLALVAKGNLPPPKVIRMNTPPAAARSYLNVSLWIVQGFLALTFIGGGIWKLVTPIPELASHMPWMGQVSPSFLRATAVLDLLGGLGVVVPSVTRIKPQLVVLAALGCVALMAGAIVFHVQRGEAADTPFNVLIAVLSGFVAWGRRRAHDVPL